MKPSRGNLFFLLTLIYAILFPYFLGILAYFLPSIANALIDLSTPQLIFLSQMLIVFLPTVLYFVITGTSIKEAIPIKKISIYNLLFIIGISFFIMPVMGFLGVLGEAFEPNKISDSALDLLNFPYLLGLVSMAVLPAIFEELFMRGALLSNYKNIPIFKAALINGFFFGVFHTNMQQFFYAALLGFIFSYFVYYTKSILSVILSHFIINGTNITYLYLVNKLFEYLNMDLLSEINNSGVESSTLEMLSLISIVMIPFACIVSVLMYYFIKTNKAKLLEISESEDTDDVYDENNRQLVDIVECEPCIDKYFIGVVIVFLVYTTLSVLGIVA